MKRSQRAIRLLQEYAPFIGGKDSNGQNYEFPPEEIESRQKQHLFWVKNKDEENAVGHFKLGNEIEYYIVEDCYDIKYLGLNKHFVHPSREEQLKDYLTKDQKKMLEKIKPLMKQQEEDIAAQNEARNVRLGIFSPDGLIAENVAS